MRPDKIALVNKYSKNLLYWDDRKTEPDSLTVLSSMKPFIKIFLSFFLISNLSLGAVDNEDSEKVKNIISVIEKGNRYSLFPAELFDGDVLWRIYRGSSFLENTKFITKFPNTEAFQLESQLYYPPDVNSIKKSIQIHSNIEIPGRDKFFLKPEITKSISDGRPVRIFFWVYSNNYDITLKVILKQRNTSDVFVNFGTLKFNGWRRMDAKVTLYKPQDRLNLTKFNQFELKGILLESLHTQSKGSFFIFIDQMGILVEKPETYPGSEVPDGWELY